MSYLTDLQQALRIALAALGLAQKAKLEQQMPTVPPSRVVPITKSNPNYPMENLIEAIIKVESGGDNNAIGDRHLTDKAYGCMQIRKPVCLDVNRVFGTNYHAEQMLGNRELSKSVFRMYMQIYATPKQLGRAVTDQDRARIWNGGPIGWRNPATLGYWQKVQQHLNPTA